MWDDGDVGCCTYPEQIRDFRSHSLNVTLTRSVINNDSNNYKHKHCVTRAVHEYCKATLDSASSCTRPQCPARSRIDHSSGAHCTSTLCSADKERGIVTWIPVGIFVVRHVYAFANVGGESMQPTFNPELQLHPLHRDIVLLEKWRRTFSRGDVVSLWYVGDRKV